MTVLKEVVNIFVYCMAVSTQGLGTTEFRNLIVDRGLDFPI